MSALATVVHATERRAADRVVEWLAERGVERVFGIPGGAIAPLYDALMDSPIETIVCQHEGMAAYLAYGEAVATGRPGVVLVTSGPGVLNTITGVAAAFQDEVPLLVLAGEVRSDWAGRGAIQDGGPGGLDIRTVFRTVTRFQDDLDQPERLDEVLGRAWEASLAHPRGPSLLRVPVDRASQPTPAVPEWRSSLVGALPDAALVEQAARLLSEAERPALFAGVGARSADVGRALLDLAYHLRVPIITDLEAKSLVSEDDWACLGVNGPGQSPAVLRYLEQGVDVLVSIGARFDDTSTRGFAEDLRPSKALVQIDHDATRLGRAWPADVAIAGDLHAAIRMLHEASPSLPVQRLLQRVRQVDEARQRALSEIVPDLGEAPFDPNGVVRALQRMWGSGVRYVSDIGNHLLFAAQHLVAVEPGSFHVSNGLGGMGSGIGAAMGMAAALRGSAPVVCICGDGGLLMVGNEIATCARYGIPVVLCVFDDRRLGMVDDGMRTLYDRCDIGGVADVDIAAFARSLGATVVDVAHEADLGPPGSLHGPLVLRVPVDRSVRAPNPRISGFKVSHG